MYIYTKFILKLYNVLGTNPSQNVRVHGHDQVGFCPNGIISKESFIIIDREFGSVPIYYSQACIFRILLTGKYNAHRILFPLLEKGDFFLFFRGGGNCSGKGPDEKFYKLYLILSLP